MKIKINEFEEYNLNLQGDMNLKEFHAFVFRLNRLAKVFPLDTEFKGEVKPKTPRKSLKDSPLYTNKELALKLFEGYKTAQDKKEFIINFMKENNIFEIYKTAINGKHYSQFVWALKKRWGVE